MELIAVSVNDAWAAIDAAVVVEIVGARPWTPLVEAAAATPGVLPWRGRAIAAMDIGALAPSFPRLSPGDRRHRAVIVTVGGATLGVPVDVVREVQSVSDDALKSPGMVEIEGKGMPLLDLAGFVEKHGGWGARDV